MTTLTIPISDEVSRRLQEIAEQEGISSQDLARAGLEDWLTRPRPDFLEAARYVLEMNHPFVDGNKRVGHAAMETFLVLNGYELLCPVAEQEQQILHLAEGRIKRDEFTAWMRMHSIPKGSDNTGANLSTMKPVVGP